MKLFRILAVLVLVIGVASVASAETQNVKVSGDLAFRSISHWDYDLHKKDGSAARGSGLGSSNYYDNNHYFLTTVGVQVDADLTDNVSTVVRLAHESYWGADQYGDSGSYNDETNEVGIELANVTLKEMLYSPLTVTIGRQALKYGRGFVIANSGKYDPTNSLYDGDHSSSAESYYSPYTKFDAIRAVLDYDPWTIDLAYAKVKEQKIDKNDDIDLYIANLGYVFDSYNGEAEAYYMAKYDRSSTNAVVSDRVNSVHTVGIRGSFDPLENLTLLGEIAGQFGNYVTSSQTINRDREAWALNLGGEYRMPDVNWTPIVGVEYIYWSGNEVGNDAGDYNGWDKMYASNTCCPLIRVKKDGSRNLSALFTSGEDQTKTNEHQIMVTGSFQPTDDLTVDALYGHFWLDEDISLTQNNNDIGNEIDVTLTYDYTEDVAFSLTAAWFFPGDLYDHTDGVYDETASMLVGAVEVSF